MACDSGARYVWILNNDVQADPEALCRLVEALERHSRAAAAAPAIVSASGPATILSAGMDVVVWRGRSIQRQGGRPVSELRSAPYRASALEGSGIMLRLDAVRQLGGFDEGFFMYWEDAEWTVRARRAGWDLLIVPAARVAQHIGASSSEPFRVRQMLRNRVRFVQVAGSRAELAAFLPYFAFAWLPKYSVVSALRGEPIRDVVSLHALGLRAALSALPTLGGGRRREPVPAGCDGSPEPTGSRRISPDEPLRDAPRRALYVQYSNPAVYPPLAHSAEQLARDGWRVLMLGIDSPDDSMRLGASPHPGIALRRRSYSGRGAGLRRIRHYATFLAWAVATAVRFRPDWVYASDPLSAPAGLVLSALGIPTIYHEHDAPDWAARLRRPLARRGRVSPWRWVAIRMAMFFRASLVRRARLTIVPSARRGQLLAREAGDPTSRIIVVPNYPAREEAVAATAEPSPLQRDDFVVLYHGALRPQALPLAVCDAIAQLPDGIRLRIVGFSHPEAPDYGERIRARAARLGVADRIRLSPPLRRAELLAEAAACQAGLALIRGRPWERNQRWWVGASNKVFDYLACGLAVIGPRSFEFQRAYVEPGYALAVDPEDPAAIAAAIGALAADRRKTATMGRAGRERILTDWNYEQAFAPIRDEMAAVASARRGARTGRPAAPSRRPPA